MVPPLERDWAIKMVSMREFQGKIQCQEEHKELFAKKLLDDPQAFWNNILRTVEWEVELYGRHGSCCICHKVKTALHD